MTEARKSPKPKPLHKRLSAARGLLIRWRWAIYRPAPFDKDERQRYATELAAFGDAIKAVAEARDVARLAHQHHRPKDEATA